jgi:Putative Flp pilus-assembly TadE/G-like
MIRQVLSGRSPKRDETGAVAVMVALLSIVLFGMAAIVVDLGHARAVRLEMQSVADASALAAANRLYLTGTADTTAAATAAKQYALDNYKIPLADWNTGQCTDPSPLPALAPGTNCISFNSPVTPTEVRVFVPSQRVDTPLSGPMGRSSLNLTASANARITPGASGSCGLCVLGTSTHDVQNGNIAVANGNVAMNGAVTAGPNGGIAVTAGSLAVQNGRSGNKGTFSPAITTGITVTDPLASMPMPAIPASFANKAATNPCSAGGGPGWYSTFGSASSCTLQPGLYVISGNTKLAGQHDIRGTGVTLYFVCGTYPTPVPCTSANSWDFDLNSQNTFLNITAATTAPVNGAVPNLAIVADRGWTGTLSFQGGGGGGTTTGTMYLASGVLAYGGNTQAQALRSMVIVKDLAMNGNPANFSINFSPSQNVTLNPSGLHLCYHATGAPTCN